MISAAVISVVLIVAFRWGSDKPNKRVLVNDVIDRHKKQENKQKSNTQSGNNATGWLKNGAAGLRWRRTKLDTSEA